jgi:hypothetical protein
MTSVETRVEGWLFVARPSLARTAHRAVAIRGTCHDLANSAVAPGRS